jgi:hypothetical protein
MKSLKLATRTDHQAAIELGRELRESGASSVEVVDQITDAFSDELARLTAYREVYLKRVADRVRAAKEVHHG